MKMKTQFIKIYGKAALTGKFITLNAPINKGKKI